MRPKFLASLLAAVAVVASPAPAADHPDHVGHGFVVMGDGDVHLYHLARFDSPHRWQAILRVRLTTAAGAPLDLTGEPNARADRLFSVLTADHFVLDDLAAGAVRTFSAALYAGYLRDVAGRRLVRDDLVVEVTAVEVYRALAADTPTTAAYRLWTACDTQTGKIHAAHLVEGKPSFEQLVQIEAEQPCDQSMQGVVLTLLAPAGQNRPLRDGDFAGIWRLSTGGGVIATTRQTAVLTDDEAINR